MKALRFTNNRLAVADVPPPNAENEALVRITRSGICNTDLEITRGYAGFEGTLGHEFVGVVERAFDRPEIVGKRVVGGINAGCGTCELCLAGDPRHCPTRTVLGIVGRDGAHAEFLQLPSRNLVAVPDNVTDEQAVFAEPLAAAWGVIDATSIHKWERLAIIGDGKLGLLCSKALEGGVDDMTLIGKHRSKVAIAEKAGAQGVLLDQVTPGMERQFDIVIEASGSEAGFSTALDLVKPRGRIVLKSTFHGTLSLDPARIVVDEISIIGSRCGKMTSGIQILKDGRVSVDDMITDTFPLTEGVTAMKRASEKGVLKVLLDPHI